MKKLIFHRSLLLLITALFVLSLPSCNKGPRSLKKLMLKYEEEGQKRRQKISSPFSGSVLVAKDGKTIFREAYGFADRMEMIENSIDNRYPIASLTKQFTAMLVMILVEENKLDLDDPVSKHLEHFPQEKGDSITIHHLMSNTSGLPHYEGLEDLNLDMETFIDSQYNTMELTELIGRTNLIYKPGTTFSYSSPGYLLLGAVLEEASGLPFAILLDSLITQPLGLENTGFGTNAFIEEYTIPGYRFTRNGGMEILFSKYHGKFQEAEFRDQSTLLSAGGMYSTVDDLFTWSEAVRTNQLLSPELSDIMFKANQKGYCYGWVRNEDDLMEKNLNAAHYNHTGDLSGHSSSITLYDDGTTIIYLANVQPLGDYELTHQIYLAAHGLENDLGAGKLPNTRSMTSFETDGGLAAFNNYYRQISDASGYEVLPSASAVNSIMFLYHESGDKHKTDSLKNILLTKLDPGEGLLNQTGYRFLGRHECETAIVFFKENTIRHPESPNVWDSQGDGYMDCKKYQKARDSFEEAVRLGELAGDDLLEVYRDNLKNAEKHLSGSAD